jgi:hypothetical protein
MTHRTWTWSPIHDKVTAYQTLTALMLLFTPVLMHPSPDVDAIHLR